jgi:hypothetical protein
MRRTIGIKIGDEARGVGLLYFNQQNMDALR